jgi:bifunctional DNase/RNase
MGGKQMQSKCEKCTASAEFHAHVAQDRKWIEHAQLCKDHFEAMVRDHVRNIRPSGDPELTIPTRFNVKILSARSDNSDPQCYLLQEGGSHCFWMRLSYCDALSLFWNLDAPRPSQLRTHQLFAKAISSFGANLQAVVIDEREMVESEFSGVLKLTRGDDLVELDARPSDAINLAILCSVPIWITPKAFAKRLPY